ncbi:hypothetical protein P3S67_011200 [Capsicum chacoense]
MEYRLNISSITPQTKEWTCKIQLIEKTRGRKSKDGRTRFQIVIAQDDMSISLLSAHILISTAKVRTPLPYGLPVNTFEWVIDRFIVVEQIKEDNTDDLPLPAPTRLNTISLENLEQQPRHVEFGISLTTRYNSTILINPMYPQIAELINWVKDNEEMLITYTQIISSGMSLHDDIIHIGNIETQSAGYERCRFQVQITDGSGSTTATLLGELGENLLSMRAEQIYETFNIKKDPLPLQYIEEDLANKVFKIQLRKSYSRNSDAAPVKLFVSSFVEKQDALQLPTSSASLDVGENSKRNLTMRRCQMNQKSQLLEAPHLARDNSLSTQLHQKRISLPAKERVLTQLLQLR